MRFDQFYSHSVSETKIKVLGKKIKVSFCDWVKRILENRLLSDFNEKLVIMDWINGQHRACFQDNSSLKNYFHISVGISNGVVVWIT